MTAARAIWRTLDTQLAARAFSRAWANTGNRMAARIAIMAITTRSSISVNALFGRFIDAPSLKSFNPHRPRRAGATKVQIEREDLRTAYDGSPNRITPFKGLTHPQPLPKGRGDRLGGFPPFREGGVSSICPLPFREAPCPASLPFRGGPGRGFHSSRARRCARLTYGERRREQR